MHDSIFRGISEVQLHAIRTTISCQRMALLAFPVDVIVGRGPKSQGHRTPADPYYDFGVVGKAVSSLISAPVKPNIIWKMEI